MWTPMRLSKNAFRKWSSLGLAILLIQTSALATTYYVSPSGNDANSGTSQAQAWRTIDRVNQLGSGLQPGDQVLFQRGGTYRGRINVQTSGTSSQPIVLGSYGTGEAPVISGSQVVTGWTNHSGNIWKAPVGQAVRHVFVDGELQRLARYPNTGWARTDNCSSTSTVDADLTQPAGHFNGATLIIRTTNWSYDTAHVTAYSNGTLTHTSTGNNMGAQQWGYFLRNKLALLDAPGEWYYDPAGGMLYLWCPANADPASRYVEASVHENGVYVGWQRHDVRMEDLQFRHQSGPAVRLSGTSGIEVDGCEFRDLHQAIYSTGGNSDYHHLVIENTFATAMYLLDNNSTVDHCQLNDIALHPGLGESNWGYFGIRATGSDMVFSNNRLEHIGYIGMVTEQNSLVEHNVVKHALAILNDGGGIAMDNADGMIVRENLVMDLDGEFESVAPEHTSFFSICHGIYFGNITIKNTLVEKNTVANCSSSGIHVDHTMVSTGNQVRDNVLFNNGVQLSISDYSNYNGPGAAPPYHVPAFNGQYTGNVMYCVRKDQLCMKQLHVYGANWVDYGTFDGNFYFNPYNERSILQVNHVTGEHRYFTLERWQVERGDDAASTRSPLHLDRYEVTSELSGELVQNGTFDYDLNGWSGWPSQGQMTQNYSELDNGSLKVQFSNNSTYDWFTMRQDATNAIQNGQFYRLSFSITSTMHGEVKAGLKGLTQQTGPQMIAAEQIPFDEQRRDVDMIFQSDLSDQAYCSFTNHYEEGTYWIDNISLKRVTVVELDPFERHQLFHNDQPTSQDVPLVGCWSDVDGNLYSGSITLQPFRSIVLVKEEDDLCGLSTGMEGTPVVNATNEVPFAYPNPVERGSEVRIELPDGDHLLRLLDLRGTVVHTWRQQGGTGRATIPTAIATGLYVLDLSNGSEARRQRVMIR